MKWIDGPSVTVMDRGGVYEMDRQTNYQKIKMLLQLIKFYKIFLQVLECVIKFDLFQLHFHVFCTSSTQMCMEDSYSYATIEFFLVSWFTHNLCPYKVCAKLHVC